MQQTYNMINIEIIKKWIEKKAKVLVLGCGEGDILLALNKERQAKTFGIDIDEEKVSEAISRGLSVIQGDINTDLEDYPPRSFDYVVADDVLQLTNKPDAVLKQILEIGQKVIVSFPNFAYIKIRFTILFSGRMPKTRVLPYEWYDTPNIHLFTVRDFEEFCAKENIKILDQVYTGWGGHKFLEIFPNLFSEFAFFLVSNTT